MERFDLIVIGGGSGGVRAARVAASLGAKVALCEEARLGGTCVNVGCVPKKLLSYGAEYRDRLDEAAAFGWAIEAPVPHRWEVLRDAVQGEVARLNGIYAGLLDRAGVTRVEGRAVLKDAQTVQVGERALRAEKILIATGGKPFVPAFPGAELCAISDAVFSFSRLPASMVVIGGGYIGTEIASVFSRLGTKVILVQRSEHLLSGFDDELRQHLEDALARTFELRLGCVVESVVETVVEFGAALAPGSEPPLKRVHLSGGATIDAEVVLCATGRSPNSRGMGLEALGVELSERGAIVVDADFRSSVPSIFALGDVIDRKALTPVAINEAMAFAHAQFSGATPTRALDYAIIPTAIFCDPQVGTAGLSEEEATERFAHVQVYTSTFRPMRQTIAGRQMARPQSLGEGDKMFMKLVVDGASDRLLGVHLVGPDAAEILQGFAVALTCGATKAQLDATVGIHPTSAEELVTMRALTREIRR